MLQITYDSNPSETDNQIICDALMDFNAKILGETGKPFSIFLKDENGNIHGGVLTWIHSDSIHIDTVWVKEEIRNQGYGTKLLKAAEQQALKEGCIFSTVNTMDFQAEDFYLNHGYERICEFKNYILGHTRFFLRKKLK